MLLVMKRRHELVNRVNYLVTVTVRSAALASTATMERLVGRLSGAVTEIGMGRDVGHEVIDEEA